MLFVRLKDRCEHWTLHWPNRGRFSLSLNISRVSLALCLVGLPVWKFTGISLLVHKVTCLLNITAALIMARVRQVAYKLAVICKWTDVFVDGMICEIHQTSPPKPSKTHLVGSRSYRSLDYMESVSLLWCWGFCQMNGKVVTGLSDIRDMNL